MSASQPLAEQAAAYDNDPANPGECGIAPNGEFSAGPCAEVYLYDASANGGQGRLICASCNPSGGRPSGGPYLLGKELTGSKVAASIPTWETQLYDPRALSADGQRLFFDSFEALVPEDTNGAVDVYQWEAAGEGRCTEAQASFNSASGGCVRLVSSGQSPSGAEFIDADEGGSEAFFRTASSLLPQDPGLTDIYDARVEGGFPPPPGRAEACEGEACQGPYNPPNDPTPASSAFEGAGNVVEPPPRKRHKKHRHHHRRANPNRRAHR